MSIEFIPYRQVKGQKAHPTLPLEALFLDVSRYGSDGWNALSPFYDHGGIPVPGMVNRVSRTVEGIWQGLKRFPEAAEDLGMLETGRPRKRRGRPVGHVYDGEVLTGVVAARQRIYIPAFTWMVVNCPKAQAKFREMVALSRSHSVFLYDRESNGDPLVDKPYAHAALLVKLVRAELEGS
jgi:hypothetical protein